MAIRGYFAQGRRPVRTSVRALLLAGGLLVAGHVWAPAPAVAQETGNFCVIDGPAGVAGCTANDGAISRFVVASITDTCVNTTGDTGTAVIELDLTIDQPARYDFGLFIDLSGSPTGALNGDNCYHDYLADPVNGATPPGPPYLNIVGDDDACGDIDINQVWTVTTDSITFTCKDNDANGQFDLQACVAYDNNQANVCPGVQGTYPGTSSKCQCFTFNILTTLAVEMKGLRAATGDGRSSQGPLAATLAATVFGMVGLAALVRRRRQPRDY